MSKKKAGSNTKCQNYLNNRTRIKNKTRKLEKRLKFSTMQEETKGKVIKNSRIGRKAEGFAKEMFKFNHPKNENNRNIKTDVKPSR